MSELLKDAEIKGYAVGAYNTPSLEMVRGVIEAAEQENSPVIISHAEIHFKYTPLEVLAPIMISEAKRAKVPVAVHLDHGTSFSAIIKAIHSGFTSVMFDGSILPYEDNINGTKEIVRICRELGISVEAELGHVANAGEGSSEGSELYGEGDDLYTKPGQARRFVELTGVDALAAAFGTAHGVYLKQPKLDFERLKAVKEAAGIPLVMHGGSGLTEADYRKAISCGISKINYYSYAALAVAKDVREKLNAAQGNMYYHDMITWMIEAVRNKIAATMKIFGSSGRA
jgi:fructose-bisphosphate aldolase class II